MPAHASRFALETYEMNPAHVPSVWAEESVLRIAFDLSKTRCVSEGNPFAACSA